MIIKFKLVLFYLIFLSINFSNALENKIVASVNNKIITSIDVSNEIKILNLLNNNLENLSKIELDKIAKKSLIKEKIKEIELDKYYDELIIPDKNLNQYMINYIKELGFNSIEEFKIFSNNNNININSIKKKISVEILWNELIYKKFYKNVKINKENIKKEILKKNTQNEYLLSEITFNIENKNDLESKYNLIKNNIIKYGFENAALKNSISDSSKNGGRIGWVKHSSLSKKMKQTLSTLKINEFTDPIQIPSGFLILKIDQIRQVENKLNIDEEINYTIRVKTNEQLNQHSNIFFNKIIKNVQINEL